jgi:hypothetical protein
VATPRIRETRWHDPSVPWSPIVGDRLPRAAEAFGITEKLVRYSLNLDHSVGGPKAKGFQQILGIVLADADYLAGLRERSNRVVSVETGWHLRHADDRPRLVTAYISG